MKLIDVVYVIILGIVEGITEWLPISSTGHLLIVERILGKYVNNNIFTANFIEMFTVVIQLGAILAVVGIFFKKLWPFTNCKEYSQQEKWSLWKKIIIASLPVAIIGLGFDDLIDEMFFNPLTIGITLIFYGLLFILISKYYKKSSLISSVKTFGLKTAFLIGLSQVLAMIPGTSRSGITILTGLLLGCQLDVSTEFSFLLSIPVMFGASGLKLVKFLMNEKFITSQIILLIIGMLVAFLTSLMVIKWLLKFVKKESLKPFGYYRIAVGLLIIIGLIYRFF